MILIRLGSEPEIEIMARPFNDKTDVVFRRKLHGHLDVLHRPCVDDIYRITCCGTRSSRVGKAGDIVVIEGERVLGMEVFCAPGLVCGSTC